MEAITNQIEINGIRYTWMENYGKITITAFSPSGPDAPSSGDLYIPEAINGMPVAELDSRGDFLPGGPWRIHIPAGLVDIAPDSFSSPGSHRVRTAAFEVDPGNPRYFSLDGALYHLEHAGRRWEYTLTLDLVPTELTSIELPEELVSIGSEAFAWSRAGEVILPSGLRRIGNGAFAHSAVEQMILPDKVNHIGHRAFAESALSSILITGSPRTTGSGTFMECKSLTSVVFNRDTVRTVDDFAFAYCPELETVQGLEEVTRIRSHAFTGCCNLRDFPLPARLTELGRNAFESCGLCRVHVPGSLRTIESWTFSECQELTRLELGEGVAEISRYAFPRCSSLTEVVFPASLAKLGDSAFSCCTTLDDVYFRNADTKIEGQPFSCATVHALPGGSVERFADAVSADFCEETITTLLRKGGRS